jgi:hypothetical protein
MRDIVSPLDGFSSPLGPRRGSFNPASLFSAAGTTGWVYPEEPGVTLFQDAAGTIPVVNPGDPVGLSLDTSKGLVPGPELVTNGGPNFTTATGWEQRTSPPLSGSATIVGGNLRVSSGGNAFGGVCTSFTTVIGRTYKVTLSASFVSGIDGSLRVYKADNSGPSAGVATIEGTGNTTVSAVFTATATTSFIHLQASQLGTVYDYSFVSVRELPGNHAFQTTALNRPIYGRHPVTGIRNLATQTDNFGSFTQTGSLTTTLVTTGPLGTARRVTSSASTVAQRITSIGALPLATITTTIWLGYVNHQFVQVDTDGTAVQFFNVDLLNGTLGTLGGGITSATIEALSGGWLVTWTRTTGATTQASAFAFVDSLTAARRPTFAGTGNEQFDIARFQPETGSTATDYQRVGNAFDVTEAGVASVNYLSHNGTNQWLTTSSFAWGSDKATITAGVRKLSDAGGFGRVAEFGNSALTPGGIFAFYAPQNAGSSTYAMRAQGNISKDAIASGFAAPLTSVLSGAADIAGSSMSLRVNGQVAATNSALGTGNFGTNALFFGSGQGTAGFFNGRRYPSVGINTALTAAQLAQVEAWVTARTGALG